jgi:MioC protein
MFKSLPLGRTLMGAYVPSLPLKKQRLRNVRQHNFAGYENGIDYALELIGDGKTARMTGQRVGIKPGDRLTLTIDNEPIQYRVEEVDYYSSPSDMWLGFLKRIDAA